MRVIIGTLAISSAFAAAILLRSGQTLDQGYQPAAGTVEAPAYNPADFGQGPATYRVPKSDPEPAPETTPETGIEATQPPPLSEGFRARAGQFLRAGAALLRAMVEPGEDGDTPSPEDRFNAFVESQRDQLPIRLNSQLSLIDLSAADGTISFFYRLEMDGRQVNRQSLKAFRPQLEANFCGDPRLAVLRALGIKATFVLKDIRQRDLYRFFMDPSRCA